MSGCGRSLSSTPNSERLPAVLNILSQGTGTGAVNRWSAESLLRNSESFRLESCCNTVRSPSLLDGQYHGEPWELQTPANVPWYLQEEQMRSPFETVQLEHVLNVAHSMHEVPLISEPWWSSFQAEGQFDLDACSQPRRLNGNVDKFISTDHTRRQSSLHNDGQDLGTGEGAFQGIQPIERARHNVKDDPKAQHKSGQDRSTTEEGSCRGGRIPTQVREFEKMSSYCATKGNDTSNPTLTRCASEHVVGAPERTLRAGVGVKDRHSKVSTSQGPRDRRVRLSVATAIQVYDIQDRLGYDRPSKAIDWLLRNGKAATEELPDPDCRSSLFFRSSQKGEIVVFSGATCQTAAAGTSHEVSGPVRANQKTTGSYQGSNESAPKPKSQEFTSRGYDRRGYLKQAKKRVFSSTNTSEACRGELINYGTSVAVEHRWGSRANARKRARDRTMQKFQERVNFACRDGQSCYGTTKRNAKRAHPNL